MKQKIENKKSEECPTQCSICGKFYSGGSCLKPVKFFGLLRMCVSCFKKSKEKLEIECKQIGKEELKKRSWN